MDQWIYEPENFKILDKELGRRGDYTIDPNFLKKTFGNHKVLLWNNQTRKWEHIRPGDTIFRDDEGNVWSEESGLNGKRH